MTSKYDHKAATSYLSNLCKDGTPLRGRIALLSFPNEISARATDTAITVIEYTQLMALFLRAVSRFYTEQVTNSIEIFPILLVFVKFFSPGNLLPLNKNGLQAINTVLEISIAFYVVRISLFFYVIWLALKRKTNSGLLIRSWQWIFYLQTKVLFNAFNSIYSNIYEAASKDLLGLNSNQRYAYMAACMVMIALEFAFSLILTTQFVNILPFKRFSASKNNSLELNVLMHKFANNMVRRIFELSYDVAIWVYGPMNILFSLVRIYQVFHTLPVYNYKALKLQIFLLIVTFTLSVACFANVALDYKRVNLNFVIILWIILTILCLKFAFAYLEKKLWTLAFEKGTNAKRNPETLVHKIIFIKHILTQNKLPTNIASKSNINHLLCSTLTQTNPALNCEDLQSRASRNRVFMHYLENLMAQFPKNNFLKLYTAYSYSRKNKLYGLSIKTLAEINSNYPTVVTSKSILKHFIQTKTQFDYQHGDYCLLNLYDYCKGVANLSKLKLKMTEQAKLQWTLCHEIISTDPDLAKILRLGNKAHTIKQKIYKTFKKMQDQMPDYSIRPALLYAYYTLFLGYSSEESSKYKDISSKRSQKYQKQFENDQLLQENLFQEDTFLIAVSGEKETAGTINYISPNLVDTLERNLIGSQACMTTPPFLRVNTAALVKSLTGQTALDIQNTMRFQFFYHLRGYLVPVNYYLNINPSTYGGLSFIFICRCASQEKESLLLNEEGEIENFTKGIGETLGLFSKEGFYLADSKIPINKVCPELGQVNQAFNLITSSPQDNTKLVPRQVSNLEIPRITESQKPISLEEAKEICSVFSEETGKNITFTPILRTQSLTYRCTIRAFMVGIKVGKVVTLEKVHQEIAGENNSAIIKEEETENFDDIDCKEDVNSEWINFERLKSEQHVLMTTRNDNLSSARNLISPRRPTTTEANEKLLCADDPACYSNRTMTKVNLQEAKQKNLFTKSKPHWFFNNNNNKINQLYQQALEKPYSPFFYSTFITALYVLFLIIFVMYLYMSVNMHEGISELQVSKQILRLAEARKSYLATLDGSTRFLWTYATQPSNITSFFQGTLVSFPVVLIINIWTVGNLERVNNNLFALTSSLNQDQRESLFQKDIRMFDVNYTTSLDTYISLTSFQATDRIVEASLKSNDRAQTDLNSAVPSLRFVLRNVLNDMLIKNTQVSQSFSDSLQDKKAYFVSWIAFCFSTSLGLLFLIILGFLYVLYLQAKSESNNLFALTRLKSESIQNLKQDFLVFHHLVLENDHSTFSQDEINKTMSSTKNLKQQKQHQRQFPIYKKLWPVYYLYFFKITLLILIPIILFVINFVLFKSYLNHLSTKASQIYFVEQMSSRLGVACGSFLEVTSENDTTIIYNHQATVSLSNQISQISEMIESVSDTFGVGTSEDNDLIQDILYGDSCQYLKDSPYSFTLCQSLAKYQEKSSLINLLSNIESSMKFIYSKFINSDRTLETLLNLQVEAYNEINLYVFLVIQEQNNLIANILNDDFERLVTNSQSLNITLNTVILIVIIAESLIIHFLIINRLRQKETQFKQILGLFPASVMLPNFILKSYIMKSSNQTLNSFRDNA